MVSRFLLSLVFMGLAGCAFAPQQANLNPLVDVASSNDGNGTAIALRVTDERPSKSLGHRGSAYGPAAEITSSQELAAVVQQQLIDGLKKKGFEIVDFDLEKNPNLSVEIRLLEYSTSTGFFTGGVSVKGAVKVVARRGSESFERLYRSEDEKRVVVVPTAKTNEQWLNTALEDVLDQIFEDIGLLRFLAG